MPIQFHPDRSHITGQGAGQYRDLTVMYSSTGVLKPLEKEMMSNKPSCLSQDLSVQLSHVSVSNQQPNVTVHNKKLSASCTQQHHILKQYRSLVEFLSIV